MVLSPLKGCYYDVDDNRLTHLTGPSKLCYPFHVFHNYVDIIRMHRNPASRQVLEQVHNSIKSVEITSKCACALGCNYWNSGKFPFSMYIQCK